jgi:hypothetical protein
MRKGNWFKGCYLSIVMVGHYYFPLEGFGWIGTGFPQLGGFVEGGSLLVPSSYSFLSSGYFWVGEVDWPYSTVQKIEIFEEGKVGCN